MGVVHLLLRVDDAVAGEADAEADEDVDLGGKRGLGGTDDLEGHGGAGGRSVASHPPGDVSATARNSLRSPRPDLGHSNTGKVEHRRTGSHFFFPKTSPH